MITSGKLERIDDHSGIQLFGYGNMGEVTYTYRGFIIPAMSSGHYLDELFIVKATTEFEYDCWGRMKSMTYLDEEVVTYEYDFRFFYKL